MEDLSSGHLLMETPSKLRELKTTYKKQNHGRLLDAMTEKNLWMLFTLPHDPATASYQVFVEFDQHQVHLW